MEIEKPCYIGYFLNNKKVELTSPYVSESYVVWNEELYKILSNENIIKVGFFSEDLKNFFLDNYGVQLKGFIDLKYVAVSLRIPEQDMESLRKRFNIKELRSEAALLIYYHLLNLSRENLPILDDNKKRKKDELLKLSEQNLQ